MGGYTRIVESDWLGCHDLAIAPEGFLGKALAM
jgi:hypothetical protein